MLRDVMVSPIGDTCSDACEGKAAMMQNEIYVRRKILYAFKNRLRARFAISFNCYKILVNFLICDMPNR